MKKINCNGITFQDSMSFSYSKPSEEFSIISKIIIILLGVFGTAYTFISFFHLPHLWVPLMLCTGIYITIFGFIFAHKEYMKFTLPFTFAVYGLALLIYWRDIVNGFISAYNISIVEVLRHMDFKISPIEVDSSIIFDEKYVITVFLAFCVFVITAAVCFSVFYKPNIILIITTTVLPIGFFLYMGIVPNHIAFIMLLAFWATMIALNYATSHITHKTKKKAVTDFVKSKRKNIYYMSNPQKAAIGNVGIIVAVFCVVIFLGSNIIFLISGNVQEEKVTAIRKDVTAKIDAFSFDDLVHRADSNIIAKQKLGEKDEQTFRNITMLKAELEYPSAPIFLKGYVGSTYTGDGWTDLSDSENRPHSAMFKDFKNENKITQNMNTYLLDKSLHGSIHQISITNVADEVRFLYAPYNSIYPQNSSATYKYDSYVMNKSAEKYTVSFYNFANNTSLINNADSSDPLELEYSKYVHDVYTKLPDGKLSQIKEMFKNNNGTDIDSTIQTIDKYLNEHAVYTLNPGKTPKGKDFVEYFLYENHKGYCTYFASAATVMLRAAGFPARYVSGYTIQPSDFPIKNSAKTYSIDIKDTRAHAWTEVYVDNYGWIPLDFTPPSYLNNAAPQDTVNTSAPSETTVTAPPAPEQQQGVETTITSSQSPTETTAQSVQYNFINGKPNPELPLPKEYIPPKMPMKPSTKLNILLLGTIGIIAAFGFVLNSRRKINMNKKRQSFYSDDVNRDIVKVYVYFNQLLDFAEEDRIDEERHKTIDALAFEAKFSNHSLNREQFDELLDFTNRLALCIFSSRSASELFEMALIRNLF